MGSILCRCLGQGSYEAEGKKEINAKRMARLEQSQASYAERCYDVDKLRKMLSPEAKVATVAECTSLPVHFHEKRFYTADDLMKDAAQEEPPSDYSIWIDRVWNKDVMAFPHVIVRVATAEDVAACLTFVKKEAKGSLSISVAGGAHSSCSFNDGPVLTIDMKQMNGIEYDTASQECHVGAGAILRDVDKACTKHGRFVPLGTNGDTGVAGLTLSGGIGWFAKKFGMSIDHLVGIDVVLPNGRLHENVRDSSPPALREVLWACRGSGGNFGIVTKFHFSTRALPNNNRFLMGSVVALCPTDKMKKKAMLKWWSLYEKTSNDTISILVLPAGAPVVPTMWLHVGPEAPKGKAAVGTIPDLEGSTNIGGIINAENTWNVVDHAKVQVSIAENQRHGFYYQSFIVLNDFTEGIVSCMLEASAKATPGTAFVIFPADGLAKDSDPDYAKTSQSLRPENKAWLLIEAKIDPYDPGGYEMSKERARSCVRDLVSEVNSKNPGAVGKTMHAFGDAKDENSGETNVVPWSASRASADVIEKLRAIKSRVDPDNVLCHNRKLG